MIREGILQEYSGVSFVKNLPSFSLPCSRHQHKPHVPPVVACPRTTFQFVNINSVSKLFPHHSYIALKTISRLSPEKAVKYVVLKKNFMSFILNRDKVHCGTAYRTVGGKMHPEGPTPGKCHSARFPISDSYSS